MDLDRESQTTMDVPERYWPLFDAIWKGDRNTMETLINQDSNLLRETIVTMRDRQLNVLDVAIEAAQEELVGILIERMPGDDDFIFNRALSAAAKGGRKRIVKALVQKFLSLNLGFMIDNAMLIAILNAPRQKDVIKYLANHSQESSTDTIMASLIAAGHSDIGLDLAGRYPSLHMSKQIISQLATMTHPFPSGARLNVWDRCIYKSRLKRIVELKLMHHSTLELASAALEEMEEHPTLQILKFLWSSTTILVAVDHGISELLILRVEHRPELLRDSDFTRDLIMKALKIRTVEMFRILDTPCIMTQLCNNVMDSKSLMSAIVERTPGCPLDVAGAAFLLQREQQWFKIVEDMESPLPSTDRKSYWGDFLEKRQDMLNEAKEWMKHTSSSCSILAILILTVAFAGTFTVPRGNDSNTGSPVFLEETLLIVFSIIDALAFFFSVSATLIFLGILTSQYVADDFHYSLPRKLVLGLTLFFISLVCVLVALGTALTLLLRKRIEWIHIPITLMGGLLLSLSATLLLPLYAEMVKSTFRPRLFRSG